MKYLGKTLVLATAFGFMGAAAVNNGATASTGSDELYSENIYIHKSSAEIPDALDSNASPQADRNEKTLAAKPLETIGDLDTNADSKKISAN